MRGPLRQGSLQAVVVGEIVIGQPINVVQVWELGVIWLSRHLGCAVGVAIVVAGWRAGEALLRRTSDYIGISPPGAEPVYGPRLVEVRDAD